MTIVLNDYHSCSTCNQTNLSCLVTVLISIQKDLAVSKKKEQQLQAELESKDQKISKLEKELEEKTHNLTGQLDYMQNEVAMEGLSQNITSSNKY